MQNPVEAEIVAQVVQGLMECGVSDSDMGIISIYRAQLKLIKTAMANFGSSNVEILTADRFQGKDKDCMVISMVRSNEKNELGDLLRDWRRLNVTFTRAMSKLIVIGSRRTLQAEETLQGFFKLIDSNGWMYSLPSNCTSVYDIPLSSAASQKSSPKKTPTTNTIGMSQSSRPSVLRDIINELQSKGSSAAHGCAALHEI